MNIDVYSKQDAAHLSNLDSVIAYLDAKGMHISVAAMEALHARLMELAPKRAHTVVVSEPLHHRKG